MDTEIPIMQYQPSSTATSSSHPSPPFGHLNSGSNDTNSNLLHNELHVVRYAGRQAVCSFLQNYNCLSILKVSTKIIVFDIRTPIQLAFYALVEHDTLCAPLWDSNKCQFVGLLTVTDFIDLLYYYSCIIHKDVTLLNVESIADIMTFLALQQPPPTSNTDGSSTATTEAATSSSSIGSSNANDPPSTAPIGLLNLLQPFRGASTKCTLYRACIQLLQSGGSNSTGSTSIPTPTLAPQNFLPIVFVDDMRVLACITYTTILEFLVTHFREQRRLFDDSIYDLHIGTYGANVVTVTTQHTLRTAIQLMSQHSLSAIPVLDATTKKIIAMYSRSDITFLTRAVDAEDAVRNLNLTLYDILNASSTVTTTPQPVVPSSTTTTSAPQSSPSASPPAIGTGPSQQGPPPSSVAALAQQQQLMTTPDALRTCLPTHTLQSIFESFAIQRFNRLCVIDENEHLLGIVSAKDLVAYFLSDTIQCS